MFPFLDSLGLPVTYAVIGVGVGMAWLGIAAFTGGGLVGGYLRQRRGRTKSAGRIKATSDGLDAAPNAFLAWTGHKDLFLREKITKLLGADFPD